MLNCYTLDIFLFSLSCTSEVSFFHSSETFIIFCKYYASPRTSEQPMNPVNNEQWTVNNNQWTMTPAENMYISMKCSVCTISYTVINIDKKMTLYSRLRTALNPLLLLVHSFISSRFFSAIHKSGGKYCRLFVIGDQYIPLSSNYGGCKSHWWHMALVWESSNSDWLIDSMIDWHALIEKRGGTIMGHCQEPTRCKKCPRQAREVEKWKIVQKIKERYMFLGL